jgi:hypothetical protein
MKKKHEFGTRCKPLVLILLSEGRMRHLVGSIFSVKVEIFFIGFAAATRILCYINARRALVAVVCGVFHQRMHITRLAWPWNYDGTHLLPARSLVCMPKERTHNEGQLAKNPPRRDTEEFRLLQKAKERLYFSLTKASANF